MGATYCSNSCPAEKIKSENLKTSLLETTGKILVYLCDRGHVGPKWYRTSAGRMRCTERWQQGWFGIYCGGDVSELLCSPEQYEVLDSAKRLGGHTAAYTYLVSVDLRPKTDC